MQYQMKKIVLIGSPNVGKSVIFNHLTGTYVAVSNYPGTTVEISRGTLLWAGERFKVMDTPGIYSLLPLTDEEQVTMQMLWQEKPDIVIHVIDAKNITRMLPLTLQLIDAGLPVILNINMMDEARRLGVFIEIKHLSAVLGIPVIATSAVRGIGLQDLKQAIKHYQYSYPAGIMYSPAIETALSSICAHFKYDYGMPHRMIATLLLQNDQLTYRQIQQEPQLPQMLSIVNEAAGDYDRPLDFVLAVERQAVADKLLSGAVQQHIQKASGLRAWLDRVTMSPWTGIPLLCLVLYVGLYQFVGRFGAGFLVDWLDKRVFSQWITPAVQQAALYIPWPSLQSLLAGDYGVFSLGIRYATVIILPIVGTFFFAFAFLEDSGYLPRLAMLVDRLFRYFGLNGRAVIPLTLGLGCGTMAVLVTRTLQSRRERLLATFLLALTVPCSAQLGVVLVLLSHNGSALLLWLGYLLLVFVTIGWITSRVLPGSRSPFYMELPPLRVPNMSNVVTKAYNRMIWYFVEILPVFVATSCLLWFADRWGVMAVISEQVKPLMLLLGLPPEVSQTFILGFFRRDYGAAGLYDMAQKGVLNQQQLLVAAVTLTLFVPCVAQFVVMIKERGLVISIAMVIAIIGIALFSGWFIHILLTAVPFLL